LPVMTHKLNFFFIISWGYVMQAGWHLQGEIDAV